MEQHMVTIGIDQYLSNSALYEHRCLENINRVYKSGGKCDYKQQYKAIIEESMVSTTEWLTDNSPMDVATLGNLKIQAQESH